MFSLTSLNLKTNNNFAENPFFYYFMNILPAFLTLFLFLKWQDVKQPMYLSWGPAPMTFTINIAITSHERKIFPLHKPPQDYVSFVTFFKSEFSSSLDFY